MVQLYPRSSESDPPPPLSRSRPRVHRRPGHVAGPVCAVCARLVEAGGLGWEKHRRCALVLSAAADGRVEPPPPTDPFEGARVRPAGSMAIFEACARRELTPEEAADALMALRPMGAFPGEEPLTALRLLPPTPARDRVGWAVGYYSAWTLLAFLAAAALAVRACAVKVEVPWP